MKSLFTFFTERHLLANTLTVMILLLGFSSLMQLNREEIPSIDIGTVTINTAYPGAAPEDVEENVTNKLEDALTGIVGLKTLVSSSAENLSAITVEIDEDADQDDVLDDIEAAVAAVDDLPDDAKTPRITELKSSMKSILEVGVSSDTLSYADLRAYANEFEKRLLEVPGVAKVEATGYRDREIRIEVSPDKLVKYGLSMNDILSAIQVRNLRMTGGSLESYTSQKNVVTLAQFEEPQEVGDVIVKSSASGAMVYVKDVATVYDDFEEETVISRINSKPTISFDVIKNSSADIIRTVEAVKAMIAEEQAAMPEQGIDFLYTADESTGIRDKFAIVQSNGVTGLVLVLVVLAAFLNLHSSFWVAMCIPVSLLGVFMLMPWFDVELDSLTMSAMVIVLGMIVDDAIVIAENIFQRREKGEGPLEAAVNGLYEVALPVFTTIATTWLAFLPMFFIKGIMGKLMYVVPTTIILALGMSMVESYLILPAHLLPSLRKGNGSGFGRTWFRPIRDGFERLMRGLLQFRYAWLVLAILIFVGALVFAATSMKFVLTPQDGTIESINVTLEMPIGTSLEATSDKVREIEAAAAAMPQEEIESVVAKIGVMQQGMFRVAGPHLAMLTIDLASQSQLHRPGTEILAELRAHTANLQNIDTLTFEVSTMGPPTGSPIEFLVKGADDGVRQRAANDIVTFLRGLDGVSDIERDDKSGKDEIAIIVDYARLTRYGLTVSDVAQTVRTAYDGEVATTTRYGDENVDFRVILQQDYRQDLDSLKQLKVVNQQGDLINLEEVAALEMRPGVYAVYHDDGDRAITITGAIDDRVTTSLDVMEAVETEFTAERLRDYPGIRFETGGEAQETMKAMGDLLVSFAIAALGIYCLLMLLFNSLTQPLMVILAIPFGLAGIIIAFALHGMVQVSFFAAIGVIGMAGVVVNDALVLVSHLNDLKRDKRRDETMIDLIASGTANRLRPVFLTTFTTVAGLLPLAYGLGGYDAMMSPMAMALGYGLLFAVPITLVLLPCLYMIGYDIERALTSALTKAKALGKRQPSAELVPQPEEM